MARTHSCPGASSTTRVMIASAPGSSMLRGAALGTVVARGLEPVVAVGEHDAWRSPTVSAMARRVSGSVMRHSEWWKPSSSVAVANGCAVDVVGERGREPVREREAPDRVEVGAGRAQQLEAVALRLRQRALVGHHVAPGVVEAERADHPGGALREAVVAGEVHPVDRERRRVVGDEHAVGAPLRQRRGGAVVAVGEDQPDRIVRVARHQRGTRFGFDHVVGWGAHRGDVGGAVTDSGEGKKFGHGRDSVGGQSPDSRIRDPRSPTRRKEEAMESAYDAFQEGNRLLAYRRTPTRR